MYSTLCTYTPIPYWHIFQVYIMYLIHPITCLFSLNFFLLSLSLAECLFIWTNWEQCKTWVKFLVCVHNTSPTKPILIPIYAFLPSSSSVDMKCSQSHLVRRHTFQSFSSWSVNLLKEIMKGRLEFETISVWCLVGMLQFTCYKIHLQFCWPRKHLAQRKFQNTCEGKEL